MPAEDRVTGRLILNADDWGRDRDTTDRTLECYLAGSLSSVSAMVFMEDSERAAEIAREHGIDAGLHLNLTASFCTPGMEKLSLHLDQIKAFLRRHRYAQVLYHPGLAKSFEYVVMAQRDEFVRLYGKPPARVDGHHHMHLCSNVLFGGLLPAGTIVRRSFSFEQGEKSLVNRIYRGAVNRLLSRRHRLTDFFYSLPPFEPASRVEKILSMARSFVVEIETHPINPEEHRYLTTGEIFRVGRNCPIAAGFVLP